MPAGDWFIFFSRLTAASSALLSSLIWYESIELRAELCEPRMAAMLRSARPAAMPARPPTSIEARLMLCTSRDLIL